MEAVILLGFVCLSSVVLTGAISYANGSIAGYKEAREKADKEWRERLIKEKLARWRVDPVTGDKWFSTGAER